MAAARALQAPVSLPSAVVPTPRAPWDIHSYSPSPVGCVIGESLLAEPRGGCMIANPRQDMLHMRPRLLILVLAAIPFGVRWRNSPTRMHAFT
eukprot:4702942-Prymnesium_polylepis.1